MTTPFASQLNKKFRITEDFLENNKDSPLLKGLKKEMSFNIVKFKANQLVDQCEDIEFVLGDLEEPIVTRRKIKKGYVYSICTNPDNTPLEIYFNLIK